MNILFKKIFQNNIKVVLFDKKISSIFLKNTLDGKGKITINKIINSSLNYFFSKKNKHIKGCTFLVFRKIKIFGKIENYFNQKIYLEKSLKNYLLKTRNFNVFFCSFGSRLFMLKFLTTNKYKYLKINKILPPIKIYKNFFFKNRIFFIYLIRISLSKLLFF